MIHQDESAAARRRRLAVASIAALALHAALFAVMWRLAKTAPSEPPSAAVELQIVDEPGALPTPESAAPSADLALAPRPELSSPRKVARLEAAGSGAVATPAGPPSSGAIVPPDAGAGAEPPADLDLALDWSGFERAFGERAEADREAYRASQRRRHVEAQGFGRWRGLVLRALGGSRPFSPLGEPLSGEEERRAVADYLAILDSRIAPQFSAFLIAAGAPNEIIHAKIQMNPVLRRNPFYVAPPPGELVDPGSVLRGVGKPAMAQFALSAAGDLTELRLVATSGSGFFDASALASIGGASPFPPPPAALLSARDRAHFEWGFDKDLRQRGIASARHLVVMAAPAPRGDEPDSGIEGPPVP